MAHFLVTMSALTPKLQKSGFRQFVEAAQGLSLQQQVVSNPVVTMCTTPDLCKIYC